MIRALLLATGVVATSFQPANAVGELVAATKNMRLAAELCLRNYRSHAALPDAFNAAGFSVSEGLDAGFFEFQGPQVWGGFNAGAGAAYCYVQSSDVSLAIAEEMGERLARELFPGMVELGKPEHPVGTPIPPCDGLHIFAPQSLIVMSYSAAGNSGECLTDGTSAIAIIM